MREDIDYSFVRPLLNAFIHSKLLSPFSGKVSMESPYERDSMLKVISLPEHQSTLAELGYSAHELHERWIQPWETLNSEQRKIMLAILNASLGPSARQHVELKAYHIFRALHWTVIQVIDAFPLLEILPLKWDGQTPIYPQYEPYFPENADFLSILYLSQEHAMPVEQCLYCGALDINQTAINSKKRKVCHLPDCNTKNGNPQPHPEGCCFKAWRQIKKSFDASCADHKNLAYKVERFLQKQYRHNLEMNQPVRVLKAKPNNLKFIHEDEVLHCEPSTVDLPEEVTMCSTLHEYPGGFIQTNGLPSINKL